MDSQKNESAGLDRLRGHKWAHVWWTNRERHREWDLVGGFHDGGNEDDGGVV